MRSRVNTEIRGESLYDALPTLPGNITLANTLVFGSTKGYTKIDAGNFFISASAVYIQTSALPTSEPATSGQLWLPDRDWETALAEIKKLPASI